MPTTIPAIVPAGVPPLLEGATVTVADDVATVTGVTVMVADDDDDVTIPNDAENVVVTEAALMLKERPLKPLVPSACSTVK